MLGQMEVSEMGADADGKSRERVTHRADGRGACERECQGGARRDGPQLGAHTRPKPFRRAVHPRKMRVGHERARAQRGVAK